MITTVIFDLDDTLYDEIEYCRSGLKAVAEFIGAQPDMPSAERIFDAFWKQFSEGNRTKIFNAALDKLGVSYTEDFINSLVKVYREHEPAITLPTDSRDVLNKLKTKYTLAMLTDGFLPAQQLKVKAIGIEKYFKCIIYTEQLGREFWKPSPAGFQKIMTALNAEPENMVYVADDEKKDFIAPNKLGFLTVRVIRRAGIHTERSSEAAAAAKYVIRGISRLPDLLAKL
jgi:putative hydrolase of the HAD superfamily